MIGSQESRESNVASYCQALSAKEYDQQNKGKYYCSAVNSETYSEVVVIIKSSNLLLPCQHALELNSCCGAGPKPAAVHPTDSLPPSAIEPQLRWAVVWILPRDFKCF